jgi:peptidyl-tRNA hydrolase, PTH1 family
VKLIVGLGNPGTKYKHNRHNLGYMVVESYAKENGISWRYSRDWICYYSKQKDYILVKPVAYMNKSGETVSTISSYYKIRHKDTLVIHDELDLDLGKVRISFGGSDAGNHGVESIIKSFGTKDFARLRVGIGHPKKNKSSKIKEPSDYVLSDFLRKEKEDLPKIIATSCEAIDSFIDEGIEATMNRFN